MKILTTGRKALRLEAEAIHDAADRIGRSFVVAARLIHECRGRIIVSGIGKSGLIAQAIAQTLSATGRPALFLHPVEAVHGDLGVVHADDCAVLISKSGNTAELDGVIDYMRHLQVPIIALTGGLDSTLARAAHATIDCGVSREACPLNLAPTASTTVALAIGDALAVTVMGMAQAKGVAA